MIFSERLVVADSTGLGIDVCVAFLGVFVWTLWPGPGREAAPAARFGIEFRTSVLLARMASSGSSRSSLSLAFFRSISLLAKLIDSLTR